MLRMWFFTVFSLMNSVSAMALLLRPCATRVSTSSSRRDSEPVPSAGPSERRSATANSSSSSRGHRRREQRAAGRDRAHRLDELLGRRVLEQVAARTGAHRAGEHGVVVGGREHHDAHVGPGGAQQRARLDTATGHAEVEQDDVDAQARDEVEDLGAVVGLPDQREVGLAGDHVGDPATEQRLPVDDEDAHGSAGPLRHPGIMAPGRRRHGRHRETRYRP